jgi:hypothetical protein
VKDEDNRANEINGQLIEQSFRGGHTRAVVRVNQVDLAFEFDAATNLPAAGQPIRLALDPAAITILASDV